jgi:hypothetical protein
MSLYLGWNKLYYQEQLKKIDLNFTDRTVFVTGRWSRRGLA